MLDATVLNGVAEFFETELGESLSARTDALVTFRELGPPDLCLVVKSNQRSNISSYHYVLGTDTSSSAGIAAYLNSLTYLLGGPKQNSWKITGGTYCSYNAFSRVDVRVQVKIPGGVEAYCIDSKGDRHPITKDDIWQETFVCGVLRCIFDTSDDNSGLDSAPLLGLKKCDPLSTLVAESRFLEAAALEMWKGWQLGARYTVHSPSLTSNHLIDGICKYFRDSQRLEEAVKFFTMLYQEEKEMACILADLLIASDEEIEAVKIIHQTCKSGNISYQLLLVQSKFLAEKRQYEMAIKLAKLAVTKAPTEFATWYWLAEMYVFLEDYDSALLALNSCPMFTFYEKDAHRMPPPSRTHLPLREPNSKPETNLQKNGTLIDKNDPAQDQVHGELARLPSLTLVGTFKEAYKLLVKISNLIGWDDLLKHRGQVFVMEDEYRVFKSLEHESARNAGSNEEIEEKIEGLSVNKELPKQPETENSTANGKSPEKNKKPKRSHLSVDELIKSNKSGSDLSDTEKVLPAVLQPNTEPATRQPQSVL